MYSCIHQLNLSFYFYRGCHIEMINIYFEITVLVIQFSRYFTYFPNTLNSIWYCFQSRSVQISNALPNYYLNSCTYLKITADSIFFLFYKTLNHSLP